LIIIFQKFLLIKCLDVKPDNVMVNWSLDKQGQVNIDRVALADLDCGLKVKDGQLLRLPGAQRIGNPMWRSPEAQTGKGIHKKSDVFSYGLVVSELGSGRMSLANRRS
jgi:serine/threonine protein kinase